MQDIEIVPHTLQLGGAAVQQKGVWACDQQVASSNPALGDAA